MLWAIASSFSSTTCTGLPASTTKYRVSYSICSRYVRIFTVSTASDRTALRIGFPWAGGRAAARSLASCTALIAGSSVRLSTGMPLSTSTTFLATGSIPSFGSLAAGTRPSDRTAASPVGPGGADQPAERLERVGLVAGDVAQGVDGGDLRRLVGGLGRQRGDLVVERAADFGVGDERDAADEGLEVALGVGRLPRRVGVAVGHGPGGVGGLLDDRLLGLGRQRLELLLLGRQARPASGP